jgi:hypothetical protein
MPAEGFVLTEDRSGTDLWVDIGAGEQVVLSACFDEPTVHDAAFSAVWLGEPAREDVIGFFDSSVAQLRPHDDMPGVIAVKAFGSAGEMRYEGDLRTEMESPAAGAIADLLAVKLPRLSTAELFRLEYRSDAAQPSYVVWAPIAEASSVNHAPAEMGVYAKLSQFNRVRNLLLRFIERTSALRPEPETLNGALDELFSYAKSRAAQPGRAFQAGAAQGGS